MQKTGYARRSTLDQVLGRGFDSRHVHQTKKSERTEQVSDTTETPVAKPESYKRGQVVLAFMEHVKSWVQAVVQNVQQSNVMVEEQLPKELTHRTPRWERVSYNCIRPLEKGFPEVSEMPPFQGGDLVFAKVSESNAVKGASLTPGNVYKVVTCFKDADGQWRITLEEDPCVCHMAYLFRRPEYSVGSREVKGFYPFDPLLTPRDPVTHEMKASPATMRLLRQGEITSNIRKHDRDFRKGDKILFREYRATPDCIENKGQWSSATFKASITHVQGTPCDGLVSGWCVLSLAFKLGECLGHDFDYAGLYDRREG